MQIYKRRLGAALKHINEMNMKIYVKSYGKLCITIMILFFGGADQMQTIVRIRSAPFVFVRL